MLGSLKTGFDSDLIVAVAGDSESKIAEFCLVLVSFPSSDLRDDLDTLLLCPWNARVPCDATRRPAAVGPEPGALRLGAILTGREKCDCREVYAESCRLCLKDQKSRLRWLCFDSSLSRLQRDLGCNSIDRCKAVYLCRKNAAAIYACLL